MSSVKPRGREENYWLAHLGVILIGVLVLAILILMALREAALV